MAVEVRKAREIFVFPTSTFDAIYSFYAAMPITPADASAIHHRVGPWAVHLPQAGRGPALPFVFESG